MLRVGRTNQLWECSNVIGCLLVYTWRKINLNEYHHEDICACLLHWNVMDVTHRNVWFVVINEISHQSAVVAVNQTATLYGMQTH